MCVSVCESVCVCVCVCVYTNQAYQFCYNMITSLLSLCQVIKISYCYK